VSPPQPQGTKPSPRLKRLPTTAPSTSPTETSRISRNEEPSKDKRRRKDSKTQKPQEGKNKIPPPTLFPHFMDDYCPPMCACYGRVVQCSNKDVEDFPYGIPYNAHYILLMNNHISSIQLDLLSEYSSMEFLSLSNNRLTDGAIEGSFEGIPVLKRYLDRNQLQSVPTDLPISLEELRLDNNLLETMSEAAWAQCPSLLVLSLSNNSLGNRSGSLPPGALSPLHNLRTLNLDYNQLASEPLELPLSIKELYLRGNHLEQLNRGVFGISQMLVLDLSANRLKSKGLLRDSLINATHLESLNLEGNKLKQVPRNLPNSLKTLNLEGNLISSIKKASFRNLDNLEHLGLARNEIFKVSAGAFKALHRALHRLDLCHNKLHQVPRRLPEGLHSVALAYNKIESVPSNAFCWGSQSLTLSRLVQVRLEHNLIDMGKLDVRAFRCLRGTQVVHFH
uniref:Wu:fc23c09 n=1 Tax=Poecilia formosa TaxID=48698 RepID=A0A087XS00_POEFO